MTHDESIREQGRIARGLAAEQRELYAQVPFARDLERQPQDLERIARPVVAVAGTGAVGKSLLIQALGPKQELPWKWLEVEVPVSQDGAAVAGDESGVLGVGELAEHCVLVLSAQDAPSPEVLMWLQQLADVFPEGTLQIVLTRCDQLPEGETLASILERLDMLLKETVPQRTFVALAVSGRTGEGLDTLRQELVEKVAVRQRELLQEALKDWDTLLGDLRALLEMRDLAKLRPETLMRLRVRLDELLKEESRRLGGELPRLAEESLRELEPRLPESQRKLTQSFREKVSAKVEPRLGELRQRLHEELKRELARDVDSEATLALADRFGRLVEPHGLFFDWGFARTGGLVGVGAALLMGVARKHGGWAVMGAALLGGVLAGLFGKGAKLRTAEELKRVVSEPFLENARQRLKDATETSQADVERLCNLLQKVSELFSPERAEAYDPERLGQVVTQAASRQQQLDRELTELQWKVGLAALQEGAGRSSA
jgi:GTP-binding protein EngB required for normal cell division